VDEEAETGSWIKKMDMSDSGRVVYEGNAFPGEFNFDHARLFSFLDMLLWIRGYGRAREG